MKRLTAILPVLGLCALPMGAQDFSTELSAGFEYLGGKVEEPIVAVPASGAGAPTGFAYRQDSTAKSLSLSATRFFGGVPDDGTTPRALLPFVSRRSFVAAAVSLEGFYRNSYGVSRGVATTVESVFSGDGSSWGGALEGEWFVRPEWAVHASIAASSSRETQAFTSQQTPGSVVNGSATPLEDRWSGRLGIVARPAPEVAFELAALLGTDEIRRDGFSLLGGPGTFSSDESNADELGVALSGRALLARRRLALDAAASYSGTHGDSGRTVPSPLSFGSSHAIDRSVSGAAAWYFSRVIGAGLGFDYATRSATQGFGQERPSAAIRSVTWRASARWFPRERASVSLELSRTRTNTVSPPDSSSFYALRATDDRATLEAALRF